MDKLRAFFSNRIVMVIEAVLLLFLAVIFFNGWNIPFFGVGCIALSCFLLLDVILTFISAIGVNVTILNKVKEFFNKPLVKCIEGVILIIGGVVLFVLTFFYLNTFSILRLAFSIFAVLDGIVTMISTIGQRK